LALLKRGQFDKKSGGKELVKIQDKSSQKPQTEKKTSIGLQKEKKNSIK